MGADWRVIYLRPWQYKMLDKPGEFVYIRNS
jgi:hypothetical protein